MSIIRFEDVDVIFSARPKPALDLLDQGFSRPEIFQKTGLIVGVEKANLEINKGEICVLMGLSGSGKSSLLRCINGLNTVSRGKLFVDDLDEALKLGTRIAIMKDGKIIQYSKPEEIVLNPADDYVRNFVAHTNPLNVLCAKSLMTPLEQCVVARDEYCLDTAQNLWMTVNPQRHLTSLRKGATATHVQPWNPTQQIETLARQPTCVPPATTMRDALQIRYETGPTLIVQDEAGTVLGIVGDGELYRAQLGHNLSHPALSEPARESSVA
ncbi:ATP-binding cassette domain-containing protein [Pseudomonas sp. ABY48]|uniref:ATP-binding cassette domain-containing protein n=1 Tax=Pseudomonas sp. ABY48 TaxID=3402865 RepID=UPI003B4373D0